MTEFWREIFDDYKNEEIGARWSDWYAPRARYIRIVKKTVTEKYETGSILPAAKHITLRETDIDDMDITQHPKDP